VQHVKVTLNRFSINLESVYAGQAYSIEKPGKGKEQVQFIEMLNLGSLATNFEWESPDLSDFEVKISPRLGQIAAKQAVPISFSIKVKSSSANGSELDNVFACNVQDQVLPIGFEIRAKVIGLEVKFERVTEVDCESPASKGTGA